MHGFRAKIVIKSTFFNHFKDKIPAIVGYLSVNSEAVTTALTIE